jgi:hypothetical protein
VPAASLNRDIQEVLNVKFGLPIDAIERLALDGATARGPLVEHIKEGARPGVDRLPAVLALGRMPFDLAVEPLLDVLGGGDDPLLPAAAAWSLARHGAAAVDPFARLLERGQGAGRFWAAIGLGQTGQPEALRILRGLCEVPELVLPAAFALSKSQDMEAIPLIHRAYLDVPKDSYVNFLFELMLDGCRGPIDRFPSAPWYVHWRRRPEFNWRPRRGSSEASIFSNWLEPEALPDGMKWRKKGLKRYLKGRMRLRNWDEVYRCGSCGFMRVPLLGGRECPETAFRSSLQTESALRASVSSGGSSIATTLDSLDRIARSFGERWLSMPHAFRGTWMGVHRNLEQMMSDGLRTIEQAREALHASRARLGETFGLPMASLVNAPLREAERRLAAGEPMTEIPTLRMPSWGDACPCGSGRSMRSCCRLLN